MINTHFTALSGPLVRSEGRRGVPRIALRAAPTRQTAPPHEMGVYHRDLVLAVLALMALALGACTTPQTTALIDAPGSLPLQAEVSDVPFFPQEDFYCGPAALATVLSWSGLSAEPEALGARVYTPARHGTLQNDILAGARREGRLAVAVTSLRDLMTEIAAGHPVLVFENLSFAWYPRWHYAVAVAYDLDRREITLRSGREAERVTALATFERTWGRGGDWEDHQVHGLVCPRGRNTP